MREDKLGEMDETDRDRKSSQLSAEKPEDPKIVLGITDLDPTVQSMFRSVAGSARLTVRNTSLK